MAKDKTPTDPFPHLPRRSFYGNMQGGDALSPTTMSRAGSANTLGRAQGQKPSPQVASGTPSPAAEIVVKPKRGRPKADGPKPWEAEGITQRTWYRRRKERGE